MTEIEKLYKKIPNFKCKKGCTDCCRNYVQMAPEEMERAGSPEYAGEWCPNVSVAGCKIYKNRPFICRIYASTVIMPCPHGCAPKIPLTADETAALMHRYLEIKRRQEEEMPANRRSVP